MMSSWGMARRYAAGRGTRSNGPLININRPFLTSNGCDWSNAQEDTSGVEDVQLLGRAHQNGLEYSFKTQWPVDPFTTVDGTLTAHEIVR